MLAVHRSVETSILFQFYYNVDEKGTVKPAMGLKRLVH